MRVVGLLCFYDERADHLADYVRNLADYGIDALVALDGAYALYPGGRSVSPLGQAKALRTAAKAFGVALTLRAPRTVWAGNEPEKRTALFRLGHDVAGPADWFLVIDADERISSAGNYRGVLEDTPTECATVTHWERNVRSSPERRFFKFQPSGIEVWRTHYHYLTGDGRVLVGPKAVSADPTPVEVEHRPVERTEQRKRDRAGYYEARLLSNFEHEREAFPIPLT